MSTRTAIFVGFFSIFCYWLLCPILPVFAPEKISVKDSNVFITGASEGVGKALALEYARRGAAKVVIVSRSMEKLLKVQKEVTDKKYDTKIIPIAADLSTEEACKSALDIAVASVKLDGKLDFLVLNHITSSRFGTWLVDAKALPEGQSFVPHMFQVNAFSYIWLATAAMDVLKSSSGQIIVVSSLAAHHAAPKTAVYSATKAAINGFFTAFRSELPLVGVHNVGVTIAPIGATDTEGTQNIKDKFKSHVVKFDPPNQAASAIVVGAAARKRTVYHPHHLVFPMVLLSTLFPDLCDYIFSNTLIN